MTSYHFYRIAKNVNSVRIRIINKPFARARSTSELHAGKMQTKGHIVHDVLLRVRLICTVLDCLHEPSY